MHVETYRSSDFSDKWGDGPHDNTVIQTRAATDDDIIAADFKYRVRNTPLRRVHQHWKDWERTERWARSSGMGISSALRRLADQHGVLPRRRHCRR